MFGVGGFCNPVLTNEVATKTGFSFQEMSSYIIQNTHSRATMSLHSKNRIVILTINLSCSLQMSEPI